MVNRFCLWSTQLENGCRETVGKQIRKAQHPSRMGLCQNEGAPKLKKKVRIMHRKLPIQFVSHRKFILLNWNHHTRTQKKHVYIQNWNRRLILRLCKCTCIIITPQFGETHIFGNLSTTTKVDLRDARYIIFGSSGEFKNYKWPPLEWKGKKSFSNVRPPNTLR